MREWPSTNLCELTLVAAAKDRATSSSTMSSCGVSDRSATRASEPLRASAAGALHDVELGKQRLA